MARMLGIPSRVVIGFLPGKKVADHWEVTHPEHARLDRALLRR